MTRDQRQLMLLHGGSNGWQWLVAQVEFAVSPAARLSRKRYVVVSDVLRSALADPDDVIDLHIGPPKARNKPGIKPVTKWFIFVALVAIVAIEYRTYTFPVLMRWAQDVLHKCGL